MNLAWKDIRRKLPSFLATATGLGLLFAIVLAMGGIYRGMVEDAVLLIDHSGADFWLVQRGTFGPFAERSVVATSLESRASSVPFVAWARPFATTTIQRDLDGKMLRTTLVGLSWPDDRGAGLPLVSGRPLDSAHRDMIADVTTGLALGQKVPLAGDVYTVVGLTRGMVSSGGDGLSFLTTNDVLSVQTYLPPEAIRMARPADPSQASPQAPVLAAVLVRMAPSADASQVRKQLMSFQDVSVYSSEEQRALLLSGVVDKSRRQIGLFRGLLVLVSAIVVSLVVFNMTVAKTREIALLKLMGARLRVVAMMIVQQSLSLCLLAYGVAVVIARVAFDKFPRRVVVGPEDFAAVLGLVVVVGLLASLAGVRRALRISPTTILAG